MIAERAPAIRPAAGHLNSQGRTNKWRIAHFAGMASGLLVGVIVGGSLARLLAEECTTPTVLAHSEASIDANYRNSLGPFGCGEGELLIISSGGDYYVVCGRLVVNIARSAIIPGRATDRWLLRKK